MGKRHSGVLKNKVKRMSAMSDIRFFYIQRETVKAEDECMFYSFTAFFSRNIICNIFAV